MKAIVIEGGGSYGAYTVGSISKRQKEYDIAVGSSTGALIAPFALLQDYETLKRCYTTTTNEGIYKKYPFWSGGVPNLFMGFKAYALGKTGMTNSKPLRELIRKSFTEEHYNTIINSNKQLFVVVCEINSNENPAKYCSIRDYNYSDFCDMIWASTLIPGLMESMVITKGGQTIELVDGGTVENIGLSGAIKAGATEIDAYLHVVKSTGYKTKGKNLVHNLIRAVVKQREALSYKNLGKIIIDHPEVKINTNYLPHKLEGAPIMSFEPEVMTKWYNEGYKNA